MTQDEIIEMARQAARSENSRLLGCGIDDLKAFAKLVADRKQEEIIKVIERLGTWAHISEIVNEIRGQA
jgi:hypothetical protein